MYACTQGSLKPAVVHRVGETKPGDTVKFDLMRVDKGAVTAFRVRTLSDEDMHAQSMHVNGCPDHKHPDVAFCKIAVAREVGAIVSRERSELTELLETAISCGEQDDATHIEACMRKLDAQEAAEIARAKDQEELSSSIGATESPSPAKTCTSTPATPTTPMSRSSSGLSQHDRSSVASRGGAARARWWEEGEMYDEGWCSEEDADYDHDPDPDHDDEGHSVIEDDCASHIACDGEDHVQEGIAGAGDGDVAEASCAAATSTDDVQDDQLAPVEDPHAVRVGREIESVEGVYFFYQAADGERVFLHPLSMRCLLEEYGAYTLLPHSIQANALEVERFAQAEDTRRYVSA
jgi:hypothetical protein